MSENGMRHTAISVANAYQYRSNSVVSFTLAKVQLRYIEPILLAWMLPLGFLARNVAAMMTRKQII